MRIGLFDSGLGGLTVLKTLLKKYPNNEYVYYGDTLNIPYGDKTKEELIILAKKNVEFLLSKKVDMIIVACGTVSSNCLDILKELYDIPIVSILEPTIDYLNRSNYQNILVMATHATINSHIFKNNINKKIYEIETPKLVPMIENNNLLDIEEILHEYLDNYLNNIDVLVLGCTHYPILKDYIKKVVGENTNILDMSDLIKIDNDSNKSLEIYFSKIDNKIIENTKNILGINDLIIKNN